MKQIKTNVLELIGNTPILKISRYSEAVGATGANLLAKLEYLNPAGSVKDRAALNMIEDAEERGILKEGSVIIEPTSGNTGIGLAAIAAAKEALGDKLSGNIIKEIYVPGKIVNIVAK